MKRHRRFAAWPAAGLCLALILPGIAGAVGVEGLQGFDKLFGRYAPAGDCRRQPQIVVDAAGFTFEVDGQQEKVTRFEHAVSYGGNYYEGISQWFFPFRNASGWPVLMAFNAGEKPGVLTVEPHDEGWKGGPPLGTRHQALVKGSPYGKCT
jgi:hypothetical protein